MKRNLSALVASIVLAYAAIPAMAQTSTVTQSGTGNSANVNQTVGGGGNVNNSTVDQDGTYHTAIVAQSNNSSYATSTITQNGGSQNQATVTQDGNTGVIATVLHAWGGDNNKVTITQTGVTGGNATVYQQQNSNVGTIYQHNGTNLDGEINVNGYTNVAYGANGSNNTAGIDQTGSDQKARIFQHDGTYNTANTAQVGLQGDALIDQSGDLNVASISQNGFGSATNTASITQSGYGNLATTMQTGYGNMASTTQAGNFNQAYTTQTGNGFTSTTVQTGNNNLAVVWQH